MAMDEKARHFFIDIERLRGFSCILVLIQHIAWICPIPFIHVLLPQIFLVGSGAFRIFFAISGFVITFSLRDKMNELSGGVFWERIYSAKPFLYSFYKRRFFRIMPVVVFVMILSGIFFVCTDFSSVKAQTDWKLSFFRLPFEILFGVLNNSLELYQSIDRTYAGGLGPFWTLAVESQFYFLWPIALLLCRNNNSRMIMSMSLGLIFLFIIQPLVSVFIGNKYYAIYGNLSELFLGSFLAFLYDKNSQNNMCSKWQKAASAILALVIWCYPSCIPSDAFFSNVVISSASVLIVAFAIFAEESFSLPFFRKTLEFLGTRSYSFYSIQLFLANLVAWYTNSIYFEGEMFSKYEFYLYQFIIFVVTLVISTEITYRFIEKPMRNFGKY